MPALSRHMRGVPAQPGAQGSATTLDGSLPALSSSHILQLVLTIRSALRPTLIFTFPVAHLRHQLCNSSSKQHTRGLQHEQSNGILQAYLLWYVLYLDNQACLSGNGNGHFIRAFLTNDLTMPNWTRIISGFDILRPTAGWHGQDASAHLDVFTFNQEMFAQGAKLCQLQLKLRAEATAQNLRSPAGSSLLTTCTQMVDQFQNELYASWHRYCPSHLFQSNSEYTVGQLPAIARIFLDFVSSFHLSCASEGVHQTDDRLSFRCIGPTTIQRLGGLFQ
jgi:hypothetical protein